MIKEFNKNKIGKDFIVGDIHGCFSKLKNHLNAIGFNPENGDRLFSVGDLIDRGDECEMVLQWLDYDWFHPVRGNHDDYVCRYDTCDVGNWIYNGGIWFAGLQEYEKVIYKDRFSSLPIAIELETEYGKIGIVHANCPFNDWNIFKKSLANLENTKYQKNVKNSCMWDRSRIENKMFEQSKVENIDVVICGHTPLEKREWVGNVLHIDTAGWHPNGYGFTVMNIADVYLKESA